VDVQAGQPNEQTAQANTAAAPPTDPNTAENEWIQENLSSREVDRYATGIFEQVVGEIVRSTDSFTVSATDNDTWNIVQTQKTLTNYLPGTTEERFGQVTYSSNCKLRYKEIPWKDSWVASTYIGTDSFEHSDNLLGFRAQLVIPMDPSMVDCTVVRNVGDEDHEASRVAELRLTFEFSSGAKQARDAIMLHVKAQASR
jgi:hypothetical protein